MSDSGVMLAQVPWCSKRSIVAWGTGVGGRAADRME